MFLTLASEAHYEEEIKRSRFVAVSCGVSNPDEAIEWINLHRDPQATHNSWAYHIGPSMRFNDDGEVTGTAGKPIFGAIEKMGLDQVVVLVRRYFGGIRLGTGGLIRAYGGTAATCLSIAPKRPLIKLVRCNFSVPFADHGKMLRILERFQAERQQQIFTPEGIHFEITIPQEHEELLKTALRDLLKGKNCEIDFKK
ncbi:MAG: YigZ family protein [Candidatus Riflebacteria bacterium]|nr:YigZ family protein [Candidatus Riflebacteria bacterium]